MKNKYLQLLFGIILYSCTSTKHNNKIALDNKNSLIEITDESGTQKKLVPREKHGKLTDRQSLEQLLEKAIGYELNPSKPIVIIYYPGKDPCNTGSLADEDFYKRWHSELEKGLKKIAAVKPIYIYKDKEGLEKYDKIITWYKDPDGIVEKLFFEYHYPCSSFVVISKNGNYISWFGEFAKEQVWEAAKQMSK